jgi:hypothetical protein
LLGPVPPVAPSVPPEPEFGIIGPVGSSLELEHPFRSESPTNKLANFEFFVNAIGNTGDALRANYRH